MIGIAADCKRFLVWVRDNGSLVLLAANVLIAGFLVYCAVSETVFEVRARSLLARGEAAASSAGEETSQPATTAKPDPWENEKKALLARLESRRLFGEARPVSHFPRIEAILGESALVDGQWLSYGAKVGELILRGMGTNSLAMEDSEGNLRRFSLLFGGEGPASAGRQATDDGPRFGGGGKGPKGKGKSKSAKNQKGGNVNAGNKQRGKNNAWYPKGNVKSGPPPTFTPGGQEGSGKSASGRNRKGGGGGAGSGDNVKRSGNR